MGRAARKAQFQHVFTFILILMIAGVVLLLGYRFINDLLGKSCQVEDLDFTQTLGEDLRRYSGYGSYHEPAYPVPCEAERICFVDADVFGEPQEDGSYPGGPVTSEYAAIVAEARSPSTPPNNVFVVKDGRAEPLQLFSDRISVPRDVLCVNATAGRFRVGMEGRGRTVVLSDAS